MIGSRRRQGFTLIELVVVIAISAVLIGLLLPTVRKVRESASRAQCQNNLKHIVLAAHLYESATGFLPPGNDGQMVGTLVFLLPYLDQGAVYQNFSFRPDTYPYWWRDPLNYPTNPDGTGARVKTFLCPSAPDPDSDATVAIAQTGVTAGVDHAAGLSSDTTYFAAPPASRDLGRNNYLSCGGYGDQRQGTFGHYPYRGMFTFRSRNKLENIPDGAGNRLAFLESAGGYGQGLSGIQMPEGIPAGWWGNSWVMGEVFSRFGTCPDHNNPNCDFSAQGRGLGWALPGSLHEGHRINVAYGDGSVRTIPPDLDFNVYVAISGIADGYMLTGGDSALSRPVPSRYNPVAAR
jgi:prepilin-type N-terminal cleavage/methylation domain-containing protein/prepilin-type processing-associated H-X9-DG protein